MKLEKEKKRNQEKKTYGKTRKHIYVYHKEKHKKLEKKHIYCIKHKGSCTKT